MEKLISYKGYEGTAEIDLDKFICRGKILFIDDLITYQADSPKKLVDEFKVAVDDYIETCSSLNRQPLKPLKGLFNVRVPPELHKNLVLRSLQDSTSLNDVVVKALTAFVSVQTVQINHTHNAFTLNIPEKDLTKKYVSSGLKTEWSTLGTVPSSIH